MPQRMSSSALPGEQVKIVRISGVQQKKMDRILPPADTRRWVMRRKAQVVAAVRSGILTFDEACQRYSLSEEEFQSWTVLFDSHGVRGLRTTKAQDYRNSPGLDD